LQITSEKNLNNNIAERPFLLMAMETVFICPRCGNSNGRFLGRMKDKVYCRKCISFQGESAEEREPVALPNTTLSLDYQLTDDQRALSEELVMCYRKKQSVLVDAVTGAGKTEIVFALIQAVLGEGKKVAFIIPRKDVVVELSERFKKAFPLLTITALYGGHHDVLEGDLVILTAHQIFRYQKYFDAVIIDEVDAFPYRGNEVLEHFSFQAGKGFSVRMSATFERGYLDEYQARGWKVLHLWTRFHRQPIPIPRWRRWLFFLKDLYLLDQLRADDCHRKAFVVLAAMVGTRWSVGALQTLATRFIGPRF
jgi:competence protein ComFA